MKQRKKYRVAVIGGGIAGIMSAYLLQKEHETVIFESNNYLGGHANPKLIDNGFDPPFYVDTGFIIFNNVTYPLFIKFLKEIEAFDNVEDSEMSFSFGDYDKDLFFSLGTGFNNYFYQKRNFLNPQFYKMFLELLKFRKQAHKDLINNRLDNITLGDYLKEYSDFFKENIIAPTASTVWSLPSDKILDFPAKTYVNFQNNHKYLKGFGWVNSTWFTFKNSSNKYLNAFKQSYKGKILLNTPVKKIIRESDKVKIITNNIFEFDKVIIATPANNVLKILENPTETEQKIFSKWKYNKTKAILHYDSDVIGYSKDLWASWNIAIRNKKFHVTYYLNKVQNLKSKRDYFVTFDNSTLLNKNKIIEEIDFSHPIYNFDAISTHKKLKDLNGYLNSYFCGNYFGYGFHEDAINSSVKIAHKFGIDF